MLRLATFCATFYGASGMLLKDNLLSQPVSKVLSKVGKSKRVKDKKKANLAVKEPSSKRNHVCCVHRVSVDEDGNEEEVNEVDEEISEDECHAEGAWIEEGSCEDHVFHEELVCCETPGGDHEHTCLSSCSVEHADGRIEHDEADDEVYHCNSHAAHEACSAHDTAEFSVKSRKKSEKSD